MPSQPMIISWMISDCSLLTVGRPTLDMFWFSAGPISPWRGLLSWSSRHWPRPGRGELIHTPLQCLWFSPSMVCLTVVCGFIVASTCMITSLLPGFISGIPCYRICVDIFLRCIFVRHYRLFGPDIPWARYKQCIIFLDWEWFVCWNNRRLCGCSVQLRTRKYRRSCFRQRLCVYHICTCVYACIRFCWFWLFHIQWSHCAKCKL